MDFRFALGSGHPKGCWACPKSPNFGSHLRSLHEPTLATLGVWPVPMLWGFEVDDKIEPVRLFDRNFRRFLAFEVLVSKLSRVPQAPRRCECPERTGSTMENLTLEHCDGINTGIRRLAARGHVHLAFIAEGWIVEEYLEAH